MRYLLSVAVFCLTASAAHAQFTGSILPKFFSPVQEGVRPDRSMGSVTLSKQPPPLVSIPLELLTSSLELSPFQQANAQALQAKYQAAFGPLTDDSPQGSAVAALRERLRFFAKARSEGDSAMAALLSPAQQSKIPLLLKDLEDYDLVGLPMEVLPRLHLTPGQKKQFKELVAQFDVRIAQFDFKKAMDERARSVWARTNYRHLVWKERDALLTEDQKEILRKFETSSTFVRVQVVSAAYSK